MSGEALCVDATVEHVTEMKEIVDRRVMLTAAAFVDGKKKSEGKVPEASDILVENLTK